MRQSLYMLTAMKAGGTAPATERVRQRIVAWVKQTGHGAQRKLAKAVGAYFRDDARSDQWISDIINGRNDPTLRDLDALSDAMDVPPGELVRFPDKAYLELTMAETAVIETFRQLPYASQQHIVSVLRALGKNSVGFVNGKKKPVAKRYDDEVKGTGPAVRQGGSPSDGDQGSATLDPSRRAFERDLDVLITDALNTLNQLQRLRESPYLTAAHSTPESTPDSPPARREVSRDHARGFRRPRIR